MVAEVDPLEVSVNRKSSDILLKHDEPTETLRSGNTASTKSTPTGTIIERNRKDSSTPSISLEFQPPMSSIVKSPPPVTIVPAKMAGNTSNDHLKKPHEPPKLVPTQNQTQSQTIPSTMKSLATTIAAAKAATATSRSNLNFVAMGSTGGDRDTVDRPNVPLLSSQMVDANFNRGSAGANTAAPPRSMAISSAKRVSFTSTPQPLSQVPNNSISQHQTQVMGKSSGARPAPVSAGIPKPKVSPSSSLGRAIPSVSTSLKPPSFHDTAPKAPPINPVDDAIQKARLPLAGPYGSFIHPTDTSLLCARKRLRTALDQTRVLRAAFSERVYEKYRVILKPVPDHVDRIVDKIAADPIAMNKMLMEEVRAIKEEKDVERKEAQKLAATGIFNGTGADGKHPAVSASASETADQLAYIGAGLNLVILPEEDVKDSGIDMGKYKFRGPTNPETGQRVGGISAAAATAAEVLLDRVRRATILRSERQRRPNVGSKPESVVEEPATSSSILSRYHMLTIAATATPIPPVKLVGRVSPPYIPPVKQIKKAPKASSSSTVSSKLARSRSQPVMPIGSILSLNPLVEDVNPDRRPSASTSALLARGVGSKHQPQQWQHPHPDSLGGRKMSLSTNSKRGDLRGMDARMGNIGLDLPPLPPATDQTEKRSLPLHDRTQVTSARAKDALQSILSQFVLREDNSHANNDGVESSHKKGTAELSFGEMNVQSASRKRNRRATEIGLMHGMHHASEGKRKTSKSVATITAEVPGVHSTVPSTLRNPNEQSAVEPIVAFSVLQALGLIHDTPSSQKEQSPSAVQLLMELSPNDDSSPRRIPSSKFLALYRKVTSKKRSFTEAFTSDFSSVSRNLVPQPNSKATAVVPTPIVAASTGETADITNGNSSRPFATIVALDQPVAPLGALDNAEKSSEECPVVSIRGGGTDEEATFAAQQAAANHAQLGVQMGAQMGAQMGNAMSNDYFMDNADRMRRPTSAPSSRPGSSSSAPVGFGQNRASSSDGLFSGFAQNRAGPPFSPQRNAGFGMGVGAVAHRGVADRLQAQAHQLQLQAAAMNRMSPAGELADFFGAGLHQRQGFSGHSDWGNLGAQSQAMNLVPSHPSLAALGMNPHQAAMLELSARDRAARALLVREQQAAVHAAAVHRHASAAAMRGGTGVSGLSSQQAAALMNAQASQAGAGLFSASATSRFGQIGAHSAATAAAILSSPAAAALMGQSQMGASQMPNHIVLGQHSDSRPSSQHSASSAKSNKAKRPPSRPSSSKGKKTAKDEAVVVNLVTSSSGKSSDEANEKSANKRKCSEMVSQVAEKETEIVKPKKSVPISIPNPVVVKARPPSREKSPPRKKSAPSISGKVEKLGAIAPQSTISIAESSTEPIKATVQAPLIIADIEEGKTALIPDNSSSPRLPSTPGMQFFVPPVPPVLDPQMATCVLDGRIHVAISKLFLASGMLRSVTNAAALLDYLQAVGSAVPIPKALISNPLKERLNPQTLKTNGNGGHLPSIPRDIVVGIISVWLWVQHKDSFQRAFAKSGRIDVDPECKWLIQAAVDAGSRALMTELSEAMQNGGPLASAMSLARSKGGSAKVSGGDVEKQAAASVHVDTRVALIVSEALMTELCIDEEVDAVIPVYEDLVQLLDEARVNALKAKCRERVLLAAVVSQRATMSEAFAHAYVSSMVRAGEALGHGDLFELVQDEGTSTATMMPYDIFSDESGAWEDPCRPAAGYTANLTGEDLVRRAHSRGMILKSLKKMQDRGSIKGGTPDSGPYTERTQGQSQSSSAPERAGHRTPGGSMRRKASLSVSDHHVQVGTGSSRATSINQYNPQHVSTPLFFDGTNIENLPYGKYAHQTRPRALSVCSAGKDDAKDGRKRGRGRGSSTTPSQIVAAEEEPPDGRVRRSTEAVDWADVAKVFQSVNLAGASRKRASKSSSPAHQQPRNPQGKTIFAPFCNRIDDSQIVGGGSDSEEEDLSDESIIDRHQVVLDQMKGKLDKFMEGRTTAGQRARQRAQARAAEKATLDES